MTASLPLDLHALFALQQQAFAAQSFPPEAVRRDRLDRLRRLVEAHEQQIAEAICARSASSGSWTSLISAKVSRRRSASSGWEA